MKSFKQGVALRLSAVFTFVAMMLLTASSCESESGGPILEESRSTISNGSALAPTENDLDVVADIKILFLGNSHTASGRIPAAVQKMLNDRQSHQKVACRYLGGAFLDAFSSNRRTMQLIKNGDWDVVVLQGQKISMSGKYVYSTKAAETLASTAKNAGAKVFYFCEWGRYRAPGDNDPGKVDEADRIQKIYEGIADKSGGTIVPVGKSWELALEQNPKWQFYAMDGNHSNELGAFFSCLVLQQVLVEELFVEDEIELKEFKPLKRYPATIDQQKAMLGLVDKALAAHKKSQANDD